MQMTEDRTGGVLTLRPQGKRLDASVAPGFKERVGALIEAGDRKVVIDMRGIDYVDSSGLGALVALLKRLGSDGRLVLAGLQPPVTRLLAMTRLDRVFLIHDAIEAAVRAAGGQDAGGV